MTTEQVYYSGSLFPEPLNKWMNEQMNGWKDMTTEEVCFSNILFPGLSALTNFALAAISVRSRCSPCRQAESHRAVRGSAGRCSDVTMVPTCHRSDISTQCPGPGWCSSQSRCCWPTLVAGPAQSHGCWHLKQGANKSVSKGDDCSPRPRFPFSLQSPNCSLCACLMSLWFSRLGWAPVSQAMLTE